MLTLSAENQSDGMAENQNDGMTENQNDGMTEELRHYCGTETLVFDWFRKCNVEQQPTSGKQKHKHVNEQSLDSKFLKKDKTSLCENVS